MENTNAWKILVVDMEKQINQLKDLGLLRYNGSKSNKPFKIVQTEKPEVIFLLANYNPKASGLKNFLDQQVENAPRQAAFTLNFFASCFAGYGMYQESMQTLPQFKAEVNRLYALANSSVQRS
jgi:hypothetical protein